MTTVFKPRSAWTDEPRGGASLAPAGVIGMASHWPGSTTDAYGVESEARVAARLRGWWDYHVNTRGWADIGYNFAVDQAGRVWDLRGSGRVGAHAASASNPDANREWIGVLHILGDEEAPTPAMVQAHYDLWDLLEPRFPNMDEERGHGQVPGAQTSCPGPFVRTMLAAGRPDTPPVPEPPTPEPPDTENDVTVYLSPYGSTQRVRIDMQGPYVEKLSLGTYNACAQLPGHKVVVLTNAQINMLISLQGYRERRMAYVIWSQTTINRGGLQIPVIQELANIRTETLKLLEDQDVAPWTYKGRDEPRDAYAFLRGIDRKLDEVLNALEDAEIPVVPDSGDIQLTRLTPAEVAAAAVPQVPTELPPAEEVMPPGLEHAADDAPNEPVE